MRKISFAVILFSSIVIASCSKKSDDLVLPQQSQNDNNVAAPPVFGDPFYTWDQLPADLRNAAIVNGNTVDKNPTESFGPYGSSTGTGFASFPPAGSKVYAMGLSADNNGLNKIITWYKGTDNKIYYFAAGNATSFHIQKFTDDEYINTINIYANTLIKKIVITTNKKTFTYGVNGGTSNSIYSPGSQMLAFWGKYSTTNITQLYVGAYSKTWTLLSGSDAHDIAVAADGTAYLTNDAGKIYRFTNNTWLPIVGSDGRTIAANANRVALVNTVGKIYELFGNAWVQLPGSDAKDVAINSDGKIWMVNTAGNVYRYNETSWQLMPVVGSGTFLEHAYRIGAGAGQVYIVSSAGRLYKWNGAGWELQSGITAGDVSVSSDGIVWVRSNGTVYNFYNNKWTAKGASSVENIAVNNKTAFITQSSGSIRNLGY